MKLTRGSIVVAALMAAAFTAVDASAAPTVYDGMQTFNNAQITAKYTITTDGTMGVSPFGALSDANILHFSVTLSDALGTYSFNDTSGYASGTFNASGTTLSEASGRRSGSLAFTSNETYDGFATGQLTFAYYGNQVQIENADGGRYDTRPGNLAIATLAAPAVPEPAIWAMMIFGFGAIGIALRARPRSTKASLV